MGDSTYWNGSMTMNIQNGGTAKANRFHLESGSPRINVQAGGLLDCWAVLTLTSGQAGAGAVADVSGTLKAGQLYGYNPGLILQNDNNRLIIEGGGLVYVQGLGMNYKTGTTPSLSTVDMSGQGAGARLALQGGSSSVNTLAQFYALTGGTQKLNGQNFRYSADGTTWTKFDDMTVTDWFTLSQGTGTLAGYTVLQVLFTVPGEPSPNCDLKTFSWGTNYATITGAGVALTFPYGVVITSLNPVCTVSPGATVSPASGSTHDFTNPVDYTVTAQDGVTKRTYQVAVTPDPLVMNMDRAAGNLVFTWNSQVGMTYNLRSSEGLDTHPAAWNLAQGGIVPTPGDAITTTTIPQPADPRQFYVLEENPDMQAAWDSTTGQLSLTIDGTVQLQGTVRAENASGQPVPGYQVQFNSTRTSGSTDIEQDLTFTPVTPQTGVKLVFTGTISGSPEAFPIETSGAAQTRFPYIRNSVGLSHNLRNNAIYDRHFDCVVTGPGDGATVIQPGVVTAQGITFSWQSRGTSLQLVAHPRYYREHLGLTCFDPATCQPSKDSISCYCTWWAYKDGISQQIIDSIVDVFAANHLPDFGYKYLQIDAGYCGGGGSPQSFLEWNSNKFPGGATYAVNKIRSGGMKPGIWVHRVYRSYVDAYLPTIGQQHPDWFVTNPDGAPFQGSYGVWCANLHNDAALEGLVRPLFRGLKQQAWDYVKIDGAGDCLYSMREAPWFFTGIGSTPEATLRIYDQTAREILGPNVYILDCWGTAPGIQSIGSVDGCRLGSDGFQAATLSGYNSWNGVVWRNDPDHCDILNGGVLPATTMNVFGSGQANADTIERPCVTSMAGAQLLVSDPVATYQTAGNLEGMKRSSPVLFTVPGQLYNYGGGNVPWWLLEIDRPFDHWSVLAHFNWRQQSGSNWPRPGMPATAVSLADLGLPADRDYLVFEFWTQTFLGKCRGSFIAPAMDSNTAMQVFSIREARAYPWVISTTRHISQGGVCLLDESWNDTQLTLSVQSAVITGDPYVLTVYLPAGCHLAGATAGGATVTIAN